MNEMDNQDGLHEYGVNDYCRLCANIDENMIPIYTGDGALHMIENKIRTHLPFLNV